MAKKRISACWLLLLALLVAAGVLLSGGETQARYQDSDTAVAIMDTTGKGVTSNCLVTAQDAPRTVLLGELPLDGSVEVPFWLLSAGADTTENLSWGVSDALYAQYLNISVFAGYEALEPKTQLELLEDIKLDLMLCVEPTDSAREIPHYEMKIPVHVTLGDDLWGTFQVILPATITEDDPEHDDELLADPWEEATEPTEEVTEPTEEVTEPTEEATEPTEEVTEPTEETTEPTGEVLIDDSVEEPTEAPGETLIEDPTESEEDPEEQETRLKTLSSFHPSDLLPARLEMAKEITAIRLGVERQSGEETVFGAFPDYTMFSLNGGASYYMVYGGVIPQFLLENVTTLPVLLDFSYAKPDCTYLDTDGSEKMTLAMEAYTGEELTKTCTAAITLNAVPSADPVLRSQTQTEVATVDITNESNTPLMGPILTFDNRLEFEFPLEWAEAELRYSVEVLTMTDDRQLAYVPVTLAEETLHGEYVSNSNTHKLTFLMGNKFVTPGTYRVRMTWTYEDVCFLSKDTVFFINYSVRTETAAGGQEVPNDN